MRNGTLLPAVILLVSFQFAASAQVGINTDAPNSRAVLDLNSPTNDQGLLVPRLSTTQRTAEAFTSRLTQAENGLLVFDTDEKRFYFWKHPDWKAVETESTGAVWHSGVAIPENSLGAEGDYYLNVVDGNVYQKQDGAYVVALNIKGPAGPKGDLGPTGAQGPQGLKGDPGDVGPVGPQGSKGDQGLPGGVGPIGPAGPQGLQGVQGLKGDTGDAGPQGLKGDTGDVGPVGPAGPQGLKGDQGLQGEVGPIGPQGSQGLKGDTGATGSQGLKGDTGDVGPAGPAGPQGLKGDQGLQGEVGPIGPEGPQGVKGDTGAIGLQGLKGDTGATGPQGLKGDTGATGATGPAGPTGPQGIQGPIGPQGAAGIPVALRAISVTTNYTATANDDVIIGASSGITITLPDASSVPGKTFHIRHNFGLLGLLLGSVTIRAPSGNSIVDDNASQTFTIGLLAPTAVSIVAVGADKWYIIGKF